MSIPLACPTRNAGTSRAAAPAENGDLERTVKTAGNGYPAHRAIVVQPLTMSKAGKRECRQIPAVCAVCCEPVSAGPLRRCAKTAPATASLLSISIPVARRLRYAVKGRRAAQPRRRHPPDGGPHYRQAQPLRGMIPAAIKAGGVVSWEYLNLSLTPAEHFHRTRVIGAGGLEPDGVVSILKR